MAEFKTASMCISSDYCKGWNDAVREMPKWISVEDRLPEVHEEVLVFAIDGRGYPFGEPVYALTAMREYRTFNGPVKSWIQPWQYFNANYKVTHWMPLPEPPKEDETDETA